MKILFLFFTQRPKLSLVLACVWTIVIFIGCSLPGNDLPKINVFDHFDKVVHFMFFLGFFLLWSFSGTFKNKLIIFILAILFGFGIEFYQKYFVAGRSFDVWDGIWDSLGALIGLILVTTFSEK